MRLPRLLLAIAGLAALAGCGSARFASTTSALSQCTECHGGTDDSSGAPPRDTRGRTDPAVLTVGRHTAHVAAGVGCETCHPARPAISTPGHLDGRVDLAFGGLAVAGGASPGFDAATGTCSNVYCHGSTLSGGALPSPVWTGTLAEPRCGQCHGSPPPAPHPALSQCSTCHPATVKADGTIVSGGAHLNGEVDVISAHPAGYASRASAAFHGPDALRFLGGAAGAVACASCHGADLGGGTGPSCNECHSAAGFASPAWTANCTFCHGARKPTFSYAADLRLAAPPAGVAGETSGAHVGAHQVHLAPTRGATVSCSTCHAVPAPSAPLAHLDGTAAVVLPGAGAYEPSSQTCTTACHGAGPSPAWSAAGPLACDSCHGAAPATGKHPGVEPKHAFMADNCGICHGEVAGVLPRILDRTRHVNGVTDVKLAVGSYDGSSCTTACHGRLDPFPW